MTGTSEVDEGFEIVLAENEVEKDLGVHIDNRLSFKQHVAQSTAKANKVVGIIRRSFDHLSEKDGVTRIELPISKGERSNYLVELLVSND